MVGQGPAFVQLCILWPIVSRPLPFRDFKDSFAQFLLSATLGTNWQESSRRVGGRMKGWRAVVFEHLREKKRWKMT